MSDNPARIPDFSIPPNEFENKNDREDQLARYARRLGGDAPDQVRRADVSESDIAVAATSARQMYFAMQRLRAMVGEPAA